MSTNEFWNWNYSLFAICLHSNYNETFKVLGAIKIRGIKVSSLNNAYNVLKHLSSFVWQMSLWEPFVHSTMSVHCHIPAPQILPHVPQVHLYIHYHVLPSSGGRCSLLPPHRALHGMDSPSPNSLSSNWKWLLEIMLGVFIIYWVNRSFGLCQSEILITVIWAKVSLSGTK